MIGDQPSQGRLVPYCGHRLERRQRLGERYIQADQDIDVEGEVAYAINTLGFRGPEFQPDARLTVFVFGESDAFGMAVEFEECWPSRLVRMIAGERGVDPREICYMNFAECGASNSYIARMVLTQCAAVVPDLVVINFADPLRTEGHAAGWTFPVGAWFTDPAVRKKILRMGRKDPLRACLLEQLRRSAGFFEFTNEIQARLASLHELLLVQYYLASVGVRAIATIRREHDLAAGVGDDPAIAPLLAQIDSRFLAPPLDCDRLPDDRVVDDRHFGQRAHRAVASSMFEFWSGAAPVSAEPVDPAAVGVAVRAFYEAVPFNFHGSVDDAVASIRDNPLPKTYPDLHELLASGRIESVLEFGCGAGWLANALAAHYPVAVTAVDFCAAGLDRARAVAVELGTATRARFIHQDLFDYQHDGHCDLVVSLGVLHHTGRAQAAFERILRFVGLGKFIYVGLYHEPGRRVFLDMFRSLIAAQGEELAFARYRQLDHVRAADDALSRSWFRDQVLHPHETQHTFREVYQWLSRAHLQLHSTSINGFAEIEDPQELFEIEVAFAERSRRANLEEDRYFPGFFTVLASRPRSAIDQGVVDRLAVEVVPVVARATGVDLSAGLKVRLVTLEDFVGALRAEFLAAGIRPGPAAHLARELAGASVGKFMVASGEILVCGEVLVSATQARESESEAVLRAALVMECVHASDETKYGWSTILRGVDSAHQAAGFDQVIEDHARFVAMGICADNGWQEGFARYLELISRRPRIIGFAGRDAADS